MRLTKKICAIVLTIAMLLSCMCVFTVSAATAIQITGILPNPAPYISGETWFMYLMINTNLGYPDWDTGGVYTQSVEVNGVATTVNVKYAGGTNLFVEIPIAMLGDQTDIVLKAGSYTSSAGYTYELASDFTLMYENSAWTSYAGATTYHDFAVKGVGSFSGWMGYLAVNAPTATTSWAYPYLDLTITVNGTVLNPADFDFKFTGAAEAYFNITNPQGASLVEGTTVTISGYSKAYLEDRSGYAWNWGAIVLTDTFEMVYNGSAWETQIDYTDYSGKLTMTGAETNAKNPMGLHLKGDDSLNAYQIPVEGSWDYKAPAVAGANNGIFLNGTRVGGQIMKYSNANNYWYAEGFTASNVGDILIIQGAFTNDVTESRINIEKSAFIWDGTTWANYIEYTTYTGTLTTAGAETTTNIGALYAIGSDSLSGAYADTSWADRLQPMDGDENGVFVNGVKVAVEGNNGKILKYSAANQWYADIPGATTGTVVTVKGTFYNEARATKVVIEESNFQWNGSNWVDYTPVDTTVYDAMTLTGVNSVAATSPWAWYLTTAETDHTGSWGYSYNDLTVAIDGTPIDRTAFGFKYTDTNGYSVYFELREAATLSATPAVGTTITISGKSKCYENFLGEAVVGSMNGIELTETFTMVYDGTTWAVPVEYTDVTITGIASNTALNGETWFVYLPTTPSLTHPAWDDGGAYPQIVTIGGTQHTVTVKYDGASNLFMELPTSILPAVGESITVKAGQYKSTKNYGYNLTADYVMTYIGNGFMPGVYTTVTVAPSTFHSASNFNVAENAWDMYMISPTGLLGKDWDSVYTQNITVNGAATAVTIKHGGGGTDAGLMFIRIPASAVSTSGEYTVVLKAGWYADHSKGYAYRIVSDIPLYANKYGISFTDFITPSTTVKPSLSVAPDGGTATGFHLTASENDGAAYTDDWSLATRANGVSDDGTALYIGQNGFFLNGTQYVQGGTYVSGLMKKLGETKYFAALSDIGVSVSDGTVLTIKGLFHDQNGYLVEFEESTFSFNGTTWVDCLGDFSGSTMKYDVNNDGKITVKDAVVLEKYLADTYVALLSSTAADIDNSGAIDADDQRLLRRKILGIFYEYVADVPVGTPYYGTSEMVKCAYDAPKLGTVDTAAGVVNFLSDDEIDQLMDDYAAVGFTHIQTEFVAELYYSEFGEDYYVNDLLYRYYEEANERGLKVFVYSNDISSWLMSETDVDEYAPNWKAVLDLLVEQQSKHSAFAGFYMSDEPHTAGRYNNYLKVTAYLKENYPSVGMWWCNNPIAAESLIQTNIGLTYSEYVTGLGTAAGQFMYDNYVLRIQDNNISSVFDDYFLEPVWFSNLYTVAEAAKAGGFTTGITMQAVALDPDSSTWNNWMNREILSQRDIGFQVYTALAYGMKSINWFTYWEHWDTGANTLDNTAMIKGDGTKNDHYEWVLNTHANVKTLEGVLLNYDWQGTIELDLPAYDGNDDSWSTYTDADNARLVDGSVSNSGAAVIGCLQDKDGFDGYLIANAQEPHKGGSSTVSMTFHSADQAIVYGADGSVTTVDLTNGAYSVTLAAGTGVFVIPVYNG
ncbi:MAG: DUF4434 domain-containing protein [Clostridia bacterium]|nr:DUF4434 domain-containing protein [Clostridia bacterium]